MILLVAGVGAIGASGWKRRTNNDEDKQTEHTKTTTTSCEQQRSTLDAAIAHHRLTATEANPTQAELVAGGYLSKPTTDAKVLATAVDAWRRARRPTPTEAQLVADHDLEEPVADWDLSPANHEIFPSANGPCHVFNEAALIEHYRQLYQQSSNGTYSGDPEVIDRFVKATREMCSLPPAAFAENIRDYSQTNPGHIKERGEITHILCPWRLPEFQKADTRHSYFW
ncbi:hypothetical protein [Aquihabitans sp. McL0605]|uniref:hypothetical protein n=1 Tax=Aquihabitans sp. McL0605 TaxID=3415671 RepID=UPI003CF4590D